MKIFLVFALAFIAVSQTVYALKCYECGDKIGNTVCESNKQNWKNITCSKGQACMKLDGERAGKTINARMCSKGNDGCDHNEGKGNTGWTCVCSNEDYCNGSFKGQASIVGTILLAAVSLFLSN